MNNNNKTVLSRTRAQYILESYDDVITSMITQMDSHARQSGGYINRMHPDQYNQDGTRKELQLSETKNKPKTSKSNKKGKQRTPKTPSPQTSRPSK